MQADVLCSSSKGNSTLVRTASCSLLIDCGSTKTYLKSCLNQLDQEIDALDGVLITHSHSDHISQLKTFAHLPVYSWCTFRIPVNHHPVVPDAPFWIKDIKVTPFELSHDAGHTLGYVLEAEGRKLVYATDTGYFKSSHLKLISNADWYIFESNHDPEMLMATDRPVYLKQRILSPSGHLCNEEAALALAQAVGDRTRKIVLAHLSEEANTPELAVGTLKEVFEKKHIDMTGMDILAAPPRAIVHLPDAG